MGPLSLVPMPYRLLILGIIAAALFGLGWLKGEGHVQDQWDAATSKQSFTAARVEKAQAQATVQVVTEYVDRVKIVRQAGETIIKEVPVYVSTEADAACVLPRGFVRLHDAAAAGRVPQTAGNTDAAPAGITLSAVASTVADNYERCHENTEQLKSLQEWITAQEAAILHNE